MMEINPEYCIHNYQPAMNLANGYGYGICVFCGKQRPGWLTNWTEHKTLVYATTDGKEYAQSRHQSAVVKIKRQPYF
jgi:hypothetical protein